MLNTVMKMQILESILNCYQYLKKRVSIRYVILVYTMA
jgi:hypothetical protein